MLLCRSSAIVSVKQTCIICVRTYNSDLFQILRKRKDAFVLKKNHRFLSCSYCKTVI